MILLQPPSIMRGAANASEIGLSGIQMCGLGTAAVPWMAVWQDIGAAGWQYGGIFLPTLLAVQRSNVLIDQYGYAHVTDFWLARQMGKALTLEHLALNKQPEYD